MNLVEKSRKVKIKLDKMIPTDRRVNAGFVVYHRDKKGKIRYLMLKVKGEWTLSKGGIDPGESELEAAKRELWEEAGVKLEKIHGGFKHKLKFKPTVRVSKGGKAKQINVPKQETATFFLGKAKSDKVRLSGEHSAYTWAPPEKALVNIRDKERVVIAKAHKFLRKK